MSRASTFALFDFSFLFSLHAIQATSTRMMTNPATPQALRHPPLIPHNIADLIQTSSNQSPHISARHALSKERVRQTSRMIALRLPQFLANGVSSLNHLARISHEAVDIFANALFADIVRYAQSHNILQHKNACCTPLCSGSLPDMIFCRYSLIETWLHQISLTTRRDWCT
jgi:hypothetical protein